MPLTQGVLHFFTTYLPGSVGDIGQVVYQLCESGANHGIDGQVLLPMNRFLASADRIVAASPNYLHSSDVLQQLQDKTRVIPYDLRENPLRSAEMGVKAEARYRQLFTADEMGRKWTEL